MLNITKRLTMCFMIISIILSVGVQTVFAGEDIIAYDNLEIDYEENSVISFKTTATFEAYEGKLRITDPDKSLVYIGDFDGLYGDYYESVKLKEPKPGTYVAKIQIQNEEQRTYAFCFKEVLYNPSGITNLVITTDDFPENFSGKFVVKCDWKKFSLIDLCAFTYEKELDDGVIEDAGIEIRTGVSGGIEFSVLNSDEKPVSKILNVIKVKHLTEEPAYVTIVAEL